MRICVALRQPAGLDLRKDNLRSEPRWERLALEACINNPEVTEIYTSGYEWLGGKFVTGKYKGLIRPFSPTDCILLMQDWNASVISSHPFKAVIANIFHGPWMHQKEEIAQISARLNNNIFFVIGHSTLFNEGLSTSQSLPGDTFDKKNIGNHSHLGNFITMDRLFYLPLPWVPQSYYQDRFYNKNLLYSWRVIFVNQLASLTLDWAMKEMFQDPSLNLRIVTGWEPHEVKDYINNEVYWVKQDINDYFWTLEKFQPYTILRNRVRLYCNLDWSSILEEYTNAKLLITYTKHYGGPSMEAAMHGVPFVGNGNAGSMADCPGYLHAPSEEEACNIFKRLMTDHDYYNEVALRYNKYVVETYSFDTFNRTINIFLKERGLL